MDREGRGERIPLLRAFEPRPRFNHGLIEDRAVDAQDRVVGRHVDRPDVKGCFALMFHPAAPAEAKSWARGNIPGKLDYVDGQIGSRSFLVGDRFTVADAYLSWALNLCGLVGVELPANLQRYLDGIKARPAVQAALAAEGAAAAANN